MTSPSTEDVVDAMVALGWSQLSVSDERLDPLTTVFESPFAIAAVVSDPTIFEEPGGWKRCQAALADLVSSGVVSRDKDRYLAFVLREALPSKVSSIEAALADTHVARKLLIETRDGSLAEALAGAVVLAGPRIVDDHELEQGDGLLPEAVLEALGSRGAPMILNGLLAGDFDRLEE